MGGGAEKLKRVLERTVLLLGLALVPAAAAADSARLTVRQEALLRSGPTVHSETVASLATGEVLIPMAATRGTKGEWYFVSTAAGRSGWISASEVAGGDQVEKVLSRGSMSSGAAGPVVTSSTSSAGRISSIPVRMTGNAIYVPVELNDSIKTVMLMDTGATFTVLSPGLARRLRLKPHDQVTLATANGRVSAPLARVSSLKVGNAEARDLTVAVHEFAPSQRLGGLLGLNFLRQFRTSVDSEKKVLTLAPN